MQQLDRSSPVPYYYQLQELLKREIEAGTWAPGDLLPSEAELAASHSISRTVIRKALDVLEADGQVARVKGKGTLVARPKLRYEASAVAGQWRSDPLDVVAHVARVVDIRSTTAGGRLARLLGTDAEDDLIELTVVHAVGASPVSLNQVYLRTDASRDLSELLAAGRFPHVGQGEEEVLAQLARRYGLAPARSEITVEATEATDFEAELLRVRTHTPMFLLSTLVTGSDGSPIAFVRAVVRSDHFRFSVSVDHPPPGPAADGRAAGTALAVGARQTPHAWRP